ncbi:MAG: TIGR00266 family protein [Eubacteriaceae bacterium]|nr:TIGR00266 family protein [Eubacteriaceae bacterium]
MEYKIVGEPMPVAIVELAKGESIKTQRGAMSWMTPNLKMETNAGGGIGKAFGRLVAGESMFQNVYTAEGSDGMIAMASSFTGSIRAYEVTPSDPIICQKSAFLAATMGVDLSVFFQKKFGAGFFGGEGFIMQKLSGNGLVFVEIDGYAIEYDLAPRQSLLVNTGNIAVMDHTCSIDVEQVKGAANVLFGGEGLFNTRVTGPGRVVLQTMTLSGFASQIAPYMIAGKN